MSSDRVIIDAIKMAQRLLWQNLAPTHKLPDATTVMRSRDLVRSPAIQSALERSSDTFAAFTLRALERVLADRSRTDREIVSRLWDVLDDPHLNQAWGSPRIPASRSDHIQRDVDSMNLRSSIAVYPPPENTSDLADFQSRHSEAPRFAQKGREIGPALCSVRTLPTRPASRGACARCPAVTCNVS